jgi:hypothetical protein
VAGLAASLGAAFAEPFAPEVEPTIVTARRKALERDTADIAVDGAPSFVFRDELSDAPTAPPPVVASNADGLERARCSFFRQSAAFLSNDGRAPGSALGRMPASRADTRERPARPG